MELINGSVISFTEELASKAAVPGGGGASALVGAIGIALGDMVGELTVGKKKYADVEEDVKALMVKAQELRVKLLECIQKDAIAFEPLSKAYGIPKDDPTRGEVMEKCLHDAAQVPFEILCLCCEAIELQVDFAAKGSALAVSDAGTGVIICKAALQGAAINVKVNTKSMTDREYAASIDKQVDERMAKYCKMADEVFDKVYGRFC
ncbi:MAG: cyclodeaminase/cyclohydrolase family protein [Oscillospiraceae bacterium]|nr:cyclodeaminase/cyclohydrolase family protein [Oscillospiraceae bacterium]MBR6352976.1 cyclodeaminase/cyclohydrolase family protein [Oscillospiraceae bacterium]